METHSGGGKSLVPMSEYDGHKNSASHVRVLCVWPKSCRPWLPTTPEGGIEPAHPGNGSHYSPNQITVFYLVGAANCKIPAPARSTRPHLSTAPQRQVPLRGWEVYYWHGVCSGSVALLIRQQVAHSKGFSFRQTENPIDVSLRFWLQQTAKDQPHISCSHLYSRKLHSQGPQSRSERGHIHRQIQLMSTKPPIGSWKVCS